MPLSLSTDLCLTVLYIMAFTSGLENAESDTRHTVEIQASGEVQQQQLHDRPGDDYTSNKGDLWKMNISTFGFRDVCITLSEIQRVSIVASGNDGWNIDSIVTLIKDSAGGIQILSQDLDVNRWIDGDSVDSHKRFNLTWATLNAGKFFIESMIFCEKQTAISTLIYSCMFCLFVCFFFVSARKCRDTVPTFDTDGI